MQDYCKFSRCHLGHTFRSRMGSASWPSGVGIHAVHAVVPSLYVDQSELEAYDRVSAGKYTLGLGQRRMGFCTDREDINSLCLTAVSRLVEKTGISYRDIGRLEVGTETLIDKSKSVKTVLMQLFEASGNFDVEGVDTKNACYGGTAAFLNAVSWVESSSWDGRYAVVVAADIAVYAEGSARPTGGAGAVAMLIGSEAPIVVERGLRATCSKHSYDFYKPSLSSLYPIVDGQHSIRCYMSALDNCYRTYCSKARHLSDLSGESNDAVGINSFDAMIFHTPYCKLVQKALARMVVNDFANTPEERIPEIYPGLEKFTGVVLEESYFDRALEKGFMDYSRELFKRKTLPSLLLSKEIGNMYTASVYGGLVSYLLSKPAEEIAGQRIGVFSYGSGLVSTMFSLKAVGGERLENLVAGLQYVHGHLDRRRKVAPEEFCGILEMREKDHQVAPYQPTASLEWLLPGTYYLTGVDELHRRKYERVQI